MFNHEMIHLQVPGLDSQDQALNYLSQKLIDKDIVKDSFAPAILEREGKFPTGLIINKVGIAIPHTDVDHVNEEQIAIMTLQEPVTFKQMADASVEVPVQAIFMLALRQPENQLDMLQKLMAFLQNDQALEEFVSLSQDGQAKAIQILKDNQII